jgi:ankyrin repeat protein
MSIKNNWLNLLNYLNKKQLRQATNIINKWPIVLDYKDKIKYTALMHLTRLNLINLTTYCLSIYKDNINQQDIFGYTALHYAALSENTILANILISNGADISIKNNDGDTPTHIAARCGHLNMLKFLLLKSKDIKYQNLIHKALCISFLECNY